jgi:hypothetical protein
LEQPNAHGAPVTCRGPRGLRDGTVNAAVFAVSWAEESGRPDSNWDLLLQHNPGLSGVLPGKRLVAGERNLSCYPLSHGGVRRERFVVRCVPFTVDGGRGLGEVSHIGNVTHDARGRA